ncbi:hypothetical protein PTKIN_Ptkin03bG0082100 [Pterospermum kingtungense]
MASSNLFLLFQANKGVKLEDLKRVLSHPQALAQCGKILRELGLVGEEVDNTAVAAKQVAVQKLKDTGAIASTSAAVTYGLNILARNIQDDYRNVTRFLVLAREPLTLSPATDRPFKIESRPLRSQPLEASKHDDSKANGYFNYIFYVDFDFEASMADQRAKYAVRHLKEFATFLRVLGSYPVDTTVIYD